MFGQAVTDKTQVDHVQRQLLWSQQLESLNTCSSLSMLQPLSTPAQGRKLSDGKAEPIKAAQRQVARGLGVELSQGVPE